MREWSLASPWLLLTAPAVTLAVGCVSGAADKPTTSANAHGAGKTGTEAKVTAFAVDIENLRVDRISMREGGIRPDGNRDLVFTATVDGPVEALYIVRCTDKGDPLAGFRADTIAGHEDHPPELGSVVEAGHLTVWIAAVENGRFINADNGALGTLGAGTHALKLYVPNTGNLQAGSHVRLYARAADGTLVAGPVAHY
jgi:hypothetical protein